MRNLPDRFPRPYLWLLIIPALPLIARFTQFIYLPAAEFSDLTISHLPNLVYLRRALVGYGVVPLWSPAILSGFPFFADPLSGLWYPPGWLGALFPAPWAFNLLAGLHLILGCAGMARLLRLERLPAQAAWFGG